MTMSVIATADGIRPKNVRTGVIRILRLLRSWCTFVAQCRVNRYSRAAHSRPRPSQAPPQSIFAGDENGLVASTTNMIRAVKSVVPLLKTSIVMSAGCPFIDWPAST